MANVALMKNVTGSSDEPVTLPEALGATATLELVAVLVVVALVVEPLVVASAAEPLVAPSVIVTVTVVPVRVAVSSEESQSESVSTAVVEELVVVGAPVVPGIVALDGGVVGTEVVEVVMMLGRVVEADVVVELPAAISAGRITAELVEADDGVVAVLFAVAADVVEVAEVAVRSVEIVELVVELVIIQQSVVVDEALAGPVAFVEELPVEDELSKNTWAMSEPFMTHGTCTSTRPRARSKSLARISARESFRKQISRLAGRYARAVSWPFLNSLIIGLPAPGTSGWCGASARDSDSPTRDRVDVDSDLYTSLLVTHTTGSGLPSAASRSSEMALRLSTLNLDVQRHIISFLSSSSDLIALRSTSSDFADLTTSALCAMTKDMPLRCGADMVAFYRFLRIGDLSSRTPDLVKDLRFRLDRSSLAPDYLKSEHIPEDEAIAAFTWILGRCQRLRRLHLIQSEPLVPPSILFHALSNLTSLEELVINLDDGVRTADLLRLANLPLRRLACLCASRMAPELDHFAALGSLARTLVELDLPIYAHKCKSLNATFPSVRKLGLSVSRGRAFVNDLHPTFPNLSHLTLHGQCPWTHQHGMWVVDGGEAINETVRATHVEQWEGLSGVWPALVAIRVEDPRTAYLLGLHRSLASLSLTWLSHTPQHVFPTVVEDTHPSCLEFVIDYATYRGSMSVGGGPFAALSQLADLPDAVSSLRHVVVYLRRFDIWALCAKRAEPIELLAYALEGLPVTHLVIKLDLGPQYSDIIERDATNTIVGYSQDNDCYNEEDGIKLLDAAEAYATLIAGTSRMLRWIAVYVPRDRIRCWEISHQAEGAEGVWEAALWETDEDEAWGLLSAEPLREFI